MVPLTQSSTKQGRYEALDVLRALAALGVVFFHATEVCDLSSLPRANVLVAALGKIGAMGVDTFFVISGICITLVYRRSAAFSAGAFWARRWFRLWPTFAICAALFATLEVALGRFEPGAAVLATISNWGLLPGLPQATWNYVPWQKWIAAVFWTLAYEAQFYVFFPALVYLWKRRGFFPTHYVFLTLSALCYVVDSHAGLFLNRFFQFLLGCLLCDLFCPSRPGQPFPWKHLAWSNAIILVTAARGFRWEATLLAQALVLGAVFLQRRGIAPRLRAHLARVGIFSYSIYLYHSWLVVAAAWILKQGGLASGLGQLGGMVPLGIALSLAGSWVMFRLVEKHFL